MEVPEAGGVNAVVAIQLREDQRHSRVTPSIVQPLRAHSRGSRVVRSPNPGVVEVRTSRTLGARGDGVRGDEVPGCLKDRQGLLNDARNRGRPMGRWVRSMSAIRSPLPPLRTRAAG